MRKLLIIATLLTPFAANADGPSAADNAAIFAGRPDPAYMYIPSDATVRAFAACKHTEPAEAAVMCMETVTKRIMSRTDPEMAKLMDIAIAACANGADTNRPPDAAAKACLDKELVKATTAVTIGARAVIADDGMFICPEALPTGEAQAAVIAIFAAHYRTDYPGSSLEALIAARDVLLRVHHCDKTLAHIRQHTP